MIVELQDDQWLWMTQISPFEEEILWTNFSVVSPGAKFVDLEAARWDGIYRFYNRGKHRIARPLLSMLKRVCKEHSLALNIIDHRPEPEFTPIDQSLIGPDFLAGITLENYQIDAIHKACSVECGIIYFPTGSGKTEVMAGIAKAIQCPTLILANQKVVIDQIKERLELRDSVEEVGLFYAGKRPNGQMVVVGSVQSLVAPTKEPASPTRTLKCSNAAWKRRLKQYDTQIIAFNTRRKNAKLLQKLAKLAHMIMIDECDLAAGKMYQHVFKHLCKARRRYGFSGTPFDPSKPVENLRIQSHLGGIIAQESREKIQELGRIIPIKYRMLTITGDITEASIYDIAFKEHITQSPLFWSLVVKLCQMHPNEGTLILVDKEELGINLNRELDSVGIVAPFIYGKTAKPKRDEVLKAFQERRIRVMIGGKIINRGLDLKAGCENLIIATGGKLSSDLIQKIGRAVRLNSKGYSMVYDFYFRCNRYLYSHSRMRLRTVTDLGYDTAVVHTSGQISGADLIHRRFRFPK